MSSKAWTLFALVAMASTSINVHAADPRPWSFPKISMGLFFDEEDYEVINNAQSYDQDVNIACQDDNRPIGQSIWKCVDEFYNKQKIENSNSVSSQSGLSFDWNKIQIHSVKAELVQISHIVLELYKTGGLNGEKLSPERFYKILEKGFKSIVIAAESGLLAQIIQGETPAIQSMLKNVARVALGADIINVLEEEEGWEVDAGISGSGGKPRWDLGVTGSWEDVKKNYFASTLTKMKQKLSKRGKIVSKIDFERVRLIIAELEELLGRNSIRGNNYDIGTGSPEFGEEELI